MDAEYKVEKVGEHIYLIPPNEHTHTLIWMHGLGDTAKGFYPIFKSPNSPVP